MELEVIGEEVGGGVSWMGVESGGVEEVESMKGGLEGVVVGEVVRWEGDWWVGMGLRK